MYYHVSMHFLNLLSRIYCLQADGRDNFCCGMQLSLPSAAVHLKERASRTSEQNNVHWIKDSTLPLLESLKPLLINSSHCVLNRTVGSRFVFFFYLHFFWHLPRSLSSHLSLTHFIKHNGSSTWSVSVRSHASGSLDLLEIASWLIRRFACETRSSSSPHTNRTS